MLYLPKPIMSQQVPKAQPLLLVTMDGKQVGTIIVSVLDAPFSVTTFSMSRPRTVSKYDWPTRIFYRDMRTSDPQNSPILPLSHGLAVARFVVQSLRNG